MLCVRYLIFVRGTSNFFSVQLLNVFQFVYFPVVLSWRIAATVYVFATVIDALHFNFACSSKIVRALELHFYTSSFECYSVHVLPNRNVHIVDNICIVLNFWKQASVQEKWVSQFIHMQTLVTKRIANPISWGWATYV